MSDIIKLILHCFFPTRCLMCNCIITVDKICCDDCDSIVTDLDPIIKYKTDKSPYSLLLSPFYYEMGADNAVRRLKFKEQEDNASGLASYMKDVLNMTEYAGKMDLILAVPGYIEVNEKYKPNHCELIAKALAKKLKIPFVHGLLIKKRKTAKQHECSSIERKTNLLDAFKVTLPSTITNMRILLVDDVYTTGSTVNECSKTLKQAGALEVVAIVAAKTRFSKRID